MSEPYNPYSATNTTVDFAFDQNPQVGDASMVNQLTIVGILQIVLGALELMMGAILIFSGFFIIAAIKMQGPGAAPPPDAVLFGMQIYYWAAGGAAAIFSIIRIASGIGCFRFRGRLWLIISLIGGLVSVLTCYCMPFSVAMCVYGLVVAFSSGARKAFALGKAGVSAAEIKHRFMSVQYGNATAAPPSQPPMQGNVD